MIHLSQAKDLELKYTKEAELRKEFEVALKREKLEMENLSRRQSEIFEELQMAHDQNLVLEHDLTESNQAVRNLTEKLASLQHCLDSLKEERNELQRRCNDGKKNVLENGSGYNLDRRLLSPCDFVRNGKAGGIS